MTVFMGFITIYIKFIDLARFYCENPSPNCLDGRTRQAFDRLSEKVLKNIETFLGDIDP